jgi:hypothetical protein
MIDLTSIDPIILSFVKIALFAVGFFIVAITVLVLLKRSGKLAGLSAAQQEQRDYKKDLQEIVDKYPVQMQGLDWIFADYYEIVNFRRRNDTIYCRYHSYIVGFGGNRMAVIPVNVRSREATHSEPILVTQENIIQFSSARGNNTISLTGLEWKNLQKISLNGRKHITGRTVLHIEGRPSPIVFYQMNKTKKQVTLLDLAVYNNMLEPPDTDKLDMMSLRELYTSKATIEQEEENAKYSVFIQEFKKAMKMQHPQKMIKIKPLNMIVYLFFELMIWGLIIAAAIAVAKNLLHLL